MPSLAERLAPWIVGVLMFVLIHLWEGVEPALDVHVPGLFLVFGALLVAWCVLLLPVLVYQAVRFALSTPSYRRLRMAIFETNYGRDAGWYVEREGRRVALLTEYRFEEMFWYSYQIEVLTDSPEERSRILTDQSWWLECKCVFRNRELGMVAETAFPAGRVFTESGRVVMRGLNFLIEGTNRWEWLVLWVRSYFQPRRRGTGRCSSDPKR